MVPPAAVSPTTAHPLSPAPKVLPSLSLFARFWPWLAAAASGLLLALCLPGWNQAWLCWVALAPWICATWFSKKPARRKWARDAALGYVAGFVFVMCAFGWLSISLAELERDPMLLMLTPLVALYMAVYFAFWGWFLGLLVNEEAQFLRSRHNLATAFFAASAWAAHEWVRGWMFSGWGWNGLGVALHTAFWLPMIQIAEFTGVAGLSFLVAFANVILVVTMRRFIAEARRGRVRPHWDFSLTMTLIALVFSFGARVLLQKPGPGIPLRIATVQANIPQDEKFDEAFEEKIFESYDALTNLALAAGGTQLLIWPEAATPRGIFADAANHQFIADIAARGDFNFLLGSIDGDLAQHDYNIAALFTGRGARWQTYRKIHLVPFGEYIPFRKTFPPFARLAGGMVPGDFTPGGDFTVFETENPRLKIAPLICFEDTLGELTRHFVENGAQLLVNLTNDGWFGRTAQPEQHLVNAVFRAVETRRPLVRSTNTGVTCSVDPCGRVDMWLLPFRQGFQAREISVPVAGPLTFYTRHGEAFAMACAAATLAFLLARRLCGAWRR